ncbi:hypothetical protein ACSVBT_12790 [Afipia sp. TerB]
MRCTTASQIIHKGRRLAPTNSIPREGSKIRKVYDLFYANKGRPVEFQTSDCGDPNIIGKLIDFYGLDIRLIRNGSSRVGRRSQWILAGEWFGLTYVDYIADHLTPPSPRAAKPAPASQSGGQPYQAFDGVSNSVFWNVGSLPGIIQYQFTSGKVIQSYVIRLDSATGDTVPVGGWRAWTFSGSNDGSSWDTLDTRSGITLTADADNLFTFSNSASYTYYRWRVTTGGSSRATITELKMIGSPTINDMTLVTAYQAADASVSNARVLIEFDNSDSPTLNTDLKVEVTCDGGANWASASLSSVTTNSQDGRNVAETSDTACTAGTSFAARITTDNAVDVKIYGASVTVH